jgi:hypothetical protein
VLKEIGAALASLISEIIVMVIYLFLGRGKYRLVGLSDSFWKILVASLFVFCFLLSVSFLPTKDLIISIIQIVGSIVIYFGLLLILKEKISYSFFVSLKKRFGSKNESSI